MNAKELLTIIKSGNVPADFSIGGTLTPDQARAFFDLVVDQSAFMKNITTITGKKLTIPINAYNLGSQVLVRVAEGSEPTADQKAQSSNEGKNMQLLPVQLFYDLPFQTIEDNQDNPKFESIITGQIAKVFANDLLNLATNGTGDDGTTFATLNTGWIKLAQDSSTATKVNTNAVTTITGRLKAMLTAARDEYKTPNCKFIMSPADKETFIDEIAANNSLAGVQLTGKVSSYYGYEILVDPYMPDGVYLFCDTKDLVQGLNLGVKRYREIDGRKRCVEYTYDMSVDFALARDKAVTVAWDQGGA